MAGGRAKPQWSDVRGLLHLRLEDAAAELNANIAYLRRLCRDNGLAQWPGKRMRFMRATGKKVRLLEVRQGSPGAGLGAGPSSSQLANTMEIKEEDEHMIRIQEPVDNPPVGEIATLNLIDKVGLSSNNGRDEANN